MLRISIFSFIILMFICPEAEARSCRKEYRVREVCRYLAKKRNKNFRTHCPTRIRNYNRCARQNVNDTARMRTTGRPARPGVVDRFVGSGRVNYQGSAARFNTQNCLPRNAPSVNSPHSKNDGQRLAGHCLLWLSSKSL